MQNNGPESGIREMNCNNTMSGSYHIRCRGGNPAVDASAEYSTGMLCRFGGLIIGRSAECHIVLPGRSVELQHVCLEPTENPAQLRLVHLKTGRVSSVHDAFDKSVPVGEASLLSLPCSIGVADVRVSISLNE